MHGIVGGFIVSALGAMLATFGLVVFRDPAEGILVGLGIGVLLLLHRGAKTVGIESGRPAAENDRTDPAIATDPDFAVIRNFRRALLRRCGCLADARSREGASTVLAGNC